MSTQQLPEGALTFREVEVQPMSIGVICIAEMPSEFIDRVTDNAVPAGKTLERSGPGLHWHNESLV